MKLNNIIEDTRKNIYSNFDTNPSVIVNEGLFYVFKINNEIFKLLQTRAQNIIFKLLKKKYGNNYKIYKKFYDKNSADILNLPNITPNGKINPTSETIKEFNLLHKEVVNLLSSIQILDEIAEASAINLRIKKGQSSLLNKRAYSTSKIHSDVWNGHTGDAGVNIMLNGDLENNTVKYYKTIKPKKFFLKRINSYDLGKKLYEGKKLIHKAARNQLVIFDQLCLHQSYLNTNLNRISIDFVISIKKTKRDYYIDYSKSLYEYYGKQKWINFDFKRLKESKLNLSDLEKKYL